MNITVVEGNLLDQQVEVIVNAWNRNIIPWWLLLPQGVSGAIKKRGGTASPEPVCENALKLSHETQPRNSAIQDAYGCPDESTTART